MDVREITSFLPQLWPLPIDYFQHRYNFDKQYRRLQYPILVMHGLFWIHFLLAIVAFVPFVIVCLIAARLPG